ncbi:hypothetical protein [Deinococcus alpinitundrae]|uniref:hypothetical protein n=1 Tax=Deinococcus alpinitundrae TaxID=468913 RepID=UPI00137989A7|nr:hypothetical protein [Deinococcus alpinitundrae]
MPITPQVARTTRKINLAALDQQLQAEAGEAQTNVVDPDELAFLNYVFVAAHCGLYWINGDPYTYKFPKGYEAQRLPRLCAYLKRLESQDGLALFAERDKQVDLLRTRAWPAYAESCASYTYTGTGGTQLEMGYEWCGIETLTTEQDEDARPDTPPNALPVFHHPASEDFHLNALAVVYLNRMLKLPLLDLDVAPF